MKSGLLKGLPLWLSGKEAFCSAGDMGSITESGRPPRKENGNPLQYSCLENSVDRGAWWATVHGVTRVRHDLATKPPPLGCNHLGDLWNCLSCQSIYLLPSRRWKYFESNSLIVKSRDSGVCLGSNSSAATYDLSICGHIITSLCLQCLHLYDRDDLS